MIRAPFAAETSVASPLRTHSNALPFAAADRTELRDVVLIEHDYGPPALRAYAGREANFMPLTIAVVDNDASTRRLVGLYLSRMGYASWECATGKEARMKLWTLPWHIALIDRRLPDMDGVILCSDLKRDPDLKKRYVILLTGEDSPEDEVEGLEMGADDYITKPFRPQAVMARIRAGQRIVQPPIYRRAKVFIAHAHEDSSEAIAIYDGLRAAGVQPWLDKLDLRPGDEWAREIPRQIKTSDAVVVCLSATTQNKRGYVQKEFRLALDEVERLPPGRIFIIPVRLDNIQVPEEFAAYHYVDYTAADLIRQIVTSLPAV
jgi:CheY-like chemotaxis protein